MDIKVEIAEKTGRLVKLLNEGNLGGVLINSQHNFAWLTGGKNNGIDLSRENGACFLLVRRDGKKFLLASRIEMARLVEEEVSTEEFEPVEFAWEDEKASGNFIIEKARLLLKGETELVSDLALHNQVRSVENLIAGCRYRLTENEIKSYLLLGKDTGKVIGELASTLKPGSSEQEIARQVRNALAVRGINSVVTLVAADERIAKFRHPVPSERIWKKVLLIAVCAKRQGLIASLSRIICVGQIPDELQRRTEANARVLAKMLAATTPGATGAQIFKITSEAYAEEGFPGEEHLHHQGGACGYKTRDWVAHPASAEKVFVNQAFAWNPSITGTKVEETSIVSEDGIEIVTATPDFPSIVVETENGKEFSLPGILRL